MDEGRNDLVPSFVSIKHFVHLVKVNDWVAASSFNQSCHESALLAPLVRVAVAPQLGTAIAGTPQWNRYNRPLQRGPHGTLHELCLATTRLSLQP